jgi:hypothetical protein
VRNFIAGMLMMGYVTAAFFFLRFWQRTRDQLFGAFALAFILLALQRALLAGHAGHEGPVWLYLIRLSAFVVILLAIVGKNVLPSRTRE